MAINMNKNDKIKVILALLGAFSYLNRLNSTDSNYAEAFP